MFFLTKNCETPDVFWSQLVIPVHRLPFQSFVQLCMAQSILLPASYLIVVPPFVVYMAVDVHKPYHPPETHVLFYLVIDLFHSILSLN
jgi:hypothetical protein